MCPDMPIQAQPLTLIERAYQLAARYLLPLGVIVLLAGLPLLPDRSLYHKLYYGLICVPALLMALARPSRLAHLFREPIFLSFGAFVIWLWLSIAWTEATESWTSLAKWPLYVILLFVAFAQAQRNDLSRFFNSFHIAAAVFSLSTLYALVTAAPEVLSGVRLIGTGALSNPLLSSHLFGFFTVFWLIMALRSHRGSSVLLNSSIALLMLVAVLGTGSRTPLVALGLAVLWICLLKLNRQSVILILIAGISLVAIGVFAPQLILDRGFSSRPEIWQKALALILQHPLLGHGYNAPLSIPVESLGMSFSEPHNFGLGVLFDLGIIGFIPWVLMQLLTVVAGWRHRHDWRFVLASALMIYGIGAALTEGGGILSRPKEHWFLLWIPLAMMAALSATSRLKRARVRLRPVGADELNQLMDGSTVIEQDGLGPKVVKLSDGTFLKLFRRKQWLSSASLTPYSQRFAHNSLSLTERQIDTPEVIECLRFDDGSTGVHYRPLPGVTLRAALETAPDVNSRERLVRHAGHYLGMLHERGVYFRSLHLGNVLLLPNGNLALIDIADMRVFKRPLSSVMRQRNLKHMQRYKQDRSWLFEQHYDALREGYSQAASTKAADTLLRSL